MAKSVLSGILTMLWVLDKWANHLALETEYIKPQSYCMNKGEFALLRLSPVLLIFHLSVKSLASELRSSLFWGKLIQLTDLITII